MLPTNDYTTKDRKVITLCVGGKYAGDLRAPINHYLHVLSDEEIKEGDWFYADEFSPIEQAAHFEGNLVNGFIKSECKKIIATLDESLHVKTDEPNFGSYMTLSLGVRLPKISEEFVKYFISEHKKGNLIEEVDVEYEDGLNKPLDEALRSSGPLVFERLKLVDNTINIIIPKEDRLFTTKEVEDLFHKFGQQATNEQLSNGQGILVADSIRITKFLSENLK